MSLTEIISYDKDGNPERFPLFNRLFLSIIIILVALLSFGIGRLTVVGNREPVRIEYDPELTTENSQPITNTANALTAIVPTLNTVVGSKNGSRYHYLDCPGAKQIKEANKITFNSPKEAESAGYSLASNCKSR